MSYFIYSVSFILLSSLVSISTTLQKILSKLNNLEQEVKKISQHLSLSEETQMAQETTNDSDKVSIKNVTIFISL